MKRVRRAAVGRWIRWAARRHGRDHLPITIGRRRIYIVPTRVGIALGLLLAAMLVAGLNYNSNLGLAFGFLMSSMALVAMHHCHRNLLGLGVDGAGEADAFAGGCARFDLVLRNDSAIERADIEIHCAGETTVTPRVPAKSHARAVLEMRAARRGVVIQTHFELRTSYPFGWFRAWTYVQSPLTAFVAPTPGGSRAMPPATAAAAVAGSAQNAEAGGDEDFAGLRAYQAGVPLKYMAWKVVARGGDPAVRSYASRGRQPEWLEWAALAGLDTESRLAQLCRWILDNEALGNSYGLRLPGTEIPPARGARHRSACLRALAGYGAA